MKNQEDQQIINGILTENNRILKKIYIDYFPGICNFISFGNGTVGDAKDIFQDALVVIFMKARKNSDFLKVKFSTYLHGVCKILWLKTRQKHTAGFYDIHNQEMDNIDTSNDIMEDLIEMEKHKLVWKHFNELNDTCRKILQMAIDKIPLEHIMKVMGFSSIQYTKNRKTLCKKNLVMKVRSSPEFNELRNEKIRENTAIPRW